MWPYGSGADVPLPEMPGGISVVIKQFCDCRATIEAEVADPALEARVVKKLSRRSEAVKSRSS